MKSITTRMISSTLAVATVFVVIGTFPGVAVADDNYNEHCLTWPPTGVPPEHTDQACDRVVQNAAWAADHFDAESAPPEDLIPDTVYLNLPEEKSWICPLDAVDETMGSNNVNNNVFNNNLSGIDGQTSDGYVGATGHPTRWILHNRASNPIILTHINALGLEVSAMDFSTYPAHSNTAVYPRGPIVLPNTLAVVEGLQGQMFIVREYNEVQPMDAMMNEEEHKHSWKSFKSVLPPTLSFSFLPHQSRYETSKGVVHVLGKPGRVLMKHRMGNIFVKNQFGAVCPDGGMGSLLGGDSGEDNNMNTDRKGTPKDMNPECNVLRKAFINKVGCPIDIYFAPENKVEGEDYNCEIFTKHLGSLSPFLSADPTTRDIDGSTSPLKFENTYNGHSFVARMAHDQSLVARIDVDHDVVTDCPEPKRSDAGVEVQVDERLIQSMPVSNTMPVNASDFSVYTYYDMLVGTKVNATETSHVVPRKTLEKKQMHDPLLQSNHTGILSASVSLIS